MKIDIVSLFPEFFQGPFDVSILKRAIEKDLLNIRHIDIRKFSKDKHNKVDDRPYGGGPGMVLMCQPLIDSIRSAKKDASHVIYLSPQGKPLNTSICKRLASLNHLILVCGHYEGIDQRIIDKEVDEEISIGDYILTNGCIAAVVLVDAVCRFIPGVLGDPKSAFCDTFYNNMFKGPQYTRPEVFEGMEVPKVLLSGNHLEIEEEKKRRALIKMKKNRPPLYLRYLLEEKQKKVKKNLVKKEN
jgi:tRNA (guanine37-N1)-methyltransferase